MEVIDTKSNQDLTLHEQMLYFFMAIQGQTETNNDYLTRFTTIL